MRNHFRSALAGQENNVPKHEVYDSMAVKNYARPYDSGAHPSLDIGETSVVTEHRRLAEWK